MAEAAAQVCAHSRRVLRRHHGGHATLDGQALVHCGDNGIGGMAGHSASVTEAEVGVSGQSVTNISCGKGYEAYLLPSTSVILQPRASAR